jgi:hypothetical protein
MKDMTHLHCMEPQPKAFAPREDGARAALAGKIF